MTAPFEGHRALFLKAAQARYELHLAGGFPCDFVGPEGDAVAETLQMRNDTDRTNWLSLKDACNEVILAGFGAHPIQLPLRATSNRDYTPSYADTAEVLRRLRSWGAISLANLWRLKGLIQAAPTRKDLFAIDLEVGWPGSDGSPPVPPGVTPAPDPEPPSDPPPEEP